MVFIPWSDFDWFIRKGKVRVGNIYFRCGVLTKKDQKLILPNPELGKHITISVSNVKTDAHVTSDGKNGKKYKPILEITSKKLNESIKKHKKQIFRYSKFYRLTSKFWKYSSFINPKSKRFLAESGNLVNNHDIPHHKLSKLKIKDMEEMHGEVLLVYHDTGKFRGIAVYDHKRRGLKYIPDFIAKDILSDVLNIDDVKSDLSDEGFK